MAPRTMALVLVLSLATLVWGHGDKGLVAHWDFDEGKGDMVHENILGAA